MNKNKEVQEAPRSEASEEIEDIGDSLNMAHRYGLEVEVIWSALRAMKECPHYTIGQAMAAGLFEWDI